MTALGTSLATLFSSPDREWFRRPMEVRIEQRIDHKAIHAATDARIREGIPPRWPESMNLAFLAQLPLYRGELAVTRLGREPERTSIEQSTSSSDQQPTFAHNQAEAMLKRHLSPDQFRGVLECLQVLEVGPSTVVGRPCASVVGLKREGTVLWPHWLPRATDYELAIDVELGLPLFLSARCGECVFWTHEIVELNLNVEFSQELS